MINTRLWKKVIMALPKAYIDCISRFDLHRNKSKRVHNICSNLGLLSIMLLLAAVVALLVINILYG